MSTEFIHLNQNWNAEPNAPEERIEVKDNYLSLSFFANPWAYEGFEEGQRLELRFYGCSRWRLGATNDEDWYSGQCRFSKLALVLHGVRQLLRKNLQERQLSFSL